MKSRRLAASDCRTVRSVLKSLFQRAMFINWCNGKSVGPEMWFGFWKKKESRKRFQSLDERNLTQEVQQAISVPLSCLSGNIINRKTGYLDSDWSRSSRSTQNLNLISLLCSPFLYLDERTVKVDILLRYGTFLTKIEGKWENKRLILIFLIWKLQKRKY